MGAPDATPRPKVAGPKTVSQLGLTVFKNAEEKTPWSPLVTGDQTHPLGHAGQTWPLGRYPVNQPKHDHYGPSQMGRSGALRMNPKRGKNPKRTRLFHGPTRRRDISRTRREDSANKGLSLKRREGCRSPKDRPRRRREEAPHETNSHTALKGPRGFQNSSAAS